MKVLVQDIGVPLIEGLFHFVRDPEDDESGKLLPTVSDVVSSSPPLGEAIPHLATVERAEAFEEVFHLLEVMLSLSFCLNCFEIPPDQSLIEEGISLTQGSDLTIDFHHTHRS